jgi:ElaB/YqjD/DUF883 family membrane-anchored ribosome-binding protein
MTKKTARSGDDTARSGDDIAAIEDLMQDLETRLRRLNSKAKSETIDAPTEVSEFVNTALAGIAARLRDGAENVTHSVTDEAARVGTDAIKKIWNEIEHRPLATLALAAGIGYLLGLLRRD